MTDEQGERIVDQLKMLFYVLAFIAGVLISIAVSLVGINR